MVPPWLRPWQWLGTLGGLLLLWLTGLLLFGLNG